MQVRFLKGCWVAPDGLTALFFAEGRVAELADDVALMLSQDGSVAALGCSEAGFPADSIGPEISKRRYRQASNRKLK